MDQVRLSIQTFIKDLDMEGVKSVYVPTDQEDGAYLFLLWKGNRCVEVWMHDFPLQEMRWFEGKPLHPRKVRLLVQGGYWLWQFALEIVKAVLEGNYE